MLAWIIKQFPLSRPAKSILGTSWFKDLNFEGYLSNGELKTLTEKLEYLKEFHYGSLLWARVEMPLSSLTMVSYNGFKLRLQKLELEQKKGLAPVWNSADHW